MQDDFFTRTRKKIRYYGPILIHYWDRIGSFVERVSHNALSSKRGILAVVGVAFALMVFVLPTQSQVVYIHGIKIPVEIASATAARSKGLSGRTGIPEGRGMLFVFEEKERYGMWMKDMLFPIDILWINDSVVVDVIENARVPSSGDQNVPSYTPNSPANYVLELAAGQVKKLGVIVGDEIDIHL